MIQRLGEHVPRIDPSAWVHASATVIGDVTIGPDSSVWPGAVLRGDFGPIVVGANTSIQDNAVIHAERGTHIGSGCVVGHLAFTEDATVGDDCLIGVGARVLPGARLADAAIAAASAVLLGGLLVPTGYRAQGIPATLVQTDRPGVDYIRTGARRYREMARHHRDEACSVDD
jgi:carbonic anhydrase/acetyltransferase-like protein (isoleucine patch superfamily)